MRASIACQPALRYSDTLCMVFQSLGGKADRVLWRSMPGSLPRAGVGVGVLIQKEGKVLLQRRTGAHGAGTWSCPGGHIDFGETLEETAAREVKEEVGIGISDVRFLAITNDVFPDDQRHYVTVWVEAASVAGEPRVQDQRELTNVGWFEWTCLPEPLFVPLQNLVAGRSYPPKALQGKGYV